MSQILFSPPLGSHTLLFSRRLKFIALTSRNDIEIELYSNINDHSNWSPNSFTASPTDSLPDFSSNVSWQKHILDVNLPLDREEFEFTARHRLENDDEIYWNGFFTNGKITRDWKSFLHPPIVSYLTITSSLSVEDVNSRILARLLAGITSTDDLDPKSLQMYSDTICREDLLSLEDSVSVDEFKAKFLLIGNVLIIRNQNCIVGLFNTSDEEQNVLLTSNLFRNGGQVLYSRLLQCHINLPKSFEKVITLPARSFDILTVLDEKPLMGHILKFLGYIDKVFLFNGIEYWNVCGNEIGFGVRFTGRLGFQVDSKFNLDNYIITMNDATLPKKVVSLSNSALFIDVASPGVLSIIEKPKPVTNVKSPANYGLLIMLLFAGIGIGLAIGKFTLVQQTKLMLAQIK